ncbi:MAG: hypothetical protein JWM74_1529 [Myxococcaceae bacterium]|jgi:hypothetical protein|nr:hypothetical protein [Myxococcaceae bacterium]
MSPPAYTSEAERQWARIKAYVRDCQKHGLDLAKLHPEDPVGFFTRRAFIRDAQRSGMPLERAAVAAGFTSEAHWTFVERYFESIYSTLSLKADGTYEIRFVPEFDRARLLAEREREEQMARQLASTSASRILEPIQGITLERFAEISAAMLDFGAEPSRAEISTVLAELHVGPAAYGGARRGWIERMDQDTTGKLKQRYREAFRTARQARMASGVHRLDALDGAPPTAEEARARAAARRSWVEIGFGT